VWGKGRGKGVRDRRENRQLGRVEGSSLKLVLQRSLRMLQVCDDCPTHRCHVLDHTC
jgi:hypothetical protein